MFSVLGFPLPASFPAAAPPEHANEPILVYGASSSAGQYIVQVLALAGYTRVIATASPNNHSHLLSLGAFKVFDYRSSNLADQILSATGGKKIKTAIDPIAARPSFEAISKVVTDGSRLAVLFPIKEGDKVTNDVDSGMLLEVPQWIKDSFVGVEIIPVATFTYRQVGLQ